MKKWDPVYIGGIALTMYLFWGFVSGKWTDTHLISYCIILPGVLYLGMRMERSKNRK